MGPLAYRLCSVLLLSMTLLALIYGQAPPSDTCRLKIPNNRTVLKELSKHFEKDSGIAIIEYTVRFRNNSDETDFMELTSNNSYQPLRWYRTQGQESSRLLLTYKIFFGLIRLILSFGIQSVDLFVDVNPPGCLHDLANMTVENIIRDFLLIDLEKSVKQEESSSKDVNICTARFSTISNTTKLIFGCWILDSVNDELSDFHDVEDNKWSLSLYLIIVFVVIFFPGFSVMESKNKSSDEYIYTVSDNQNLTFNISCTRNYQNMEKPTLLEQSSKTIINFNRSLVDETIYKMRVKWVTFDVPATRLFTDGHWKILYDFFNAKITPSCCCTMKKTVHIYLMILIALPSIPIVYAMCDENLWYWQLAEKITTIAHSEFFPSLTFIRIYLCIIYALYVLLSLPNITCCSLRIEKFYRNILKKNKCYAECLDILNECPSKICYYIIDYCSSYCICLLPFVFIVCIILYIFCTFISFFCRVIIGKMCIAVGASWDAVIEDTHTLCPQCDGASSMCYKIMIIPYAYAILNVLLLGGMCLTITFISVIVLIVVEINIFHNVIPIIMVGLFYILDSYKEIGNRFDKLIATLIEDKRLMFKGSYNMFAFKTKHDSSINVSQSKLCLEITTPFLFVSEDDIKYISRAFANHCSKMKCERVPEALMDIYSAEIERLFKIGLFLAFVFLIIMAYGSFIFISPNKYLFLTIIAGLIPKIREKLCKRNSDVKIDESFHENIKEEMKEFYEEWTVKKMEVDVSECDPADRNIDLIIIRNANVQAEAALMDNQVNIDERVQLVPTD